MKKSLAILGSVVLLAGMTTLTVQPAQASKCIKVKSAVGKNYQAAQDTWRAQGLYVMPARDGKGWGRTSWLDRNWKVVGQIPKAGTCVKKNSDIRATIIKYTD